MQAENNDLILNNTLELVPKEDDMKEIQCMWLFKSKTKPWGILDKYKAHVVAKRQTKMESVEYFETFSLVMKHETIKIVLALVVPKDWCEK